jgi:cation:H+ antiporter
MIAASITLWVMAMDGEISGYDGAFLMLLAIGYLAFTINAGLNESKAAKKQYETDVMEGANTSKTNRSTWKIDGGQLILSLLILVFGANLVVSGAISLAHSIGISEFMIALTIVAVGTSLPEITASSFASARNNGQIVVGNVVGSNIVNILIGMGLAGLVSPAPITISWQATLVDFPIMLGCALLCLRLFNRGIAVSKRDGKVLLCAYGAYLCLQIVLAFLLDFS